MSPISTFEEAEGFDEWLPGSPALDERLQMRSVSRLCAEEGIWAKDGGGVRSLRPCRPEEGTLLRDGVDLGDGEEDLPADEPGEGLPTPPLWALLL